MTTKTTDHDNEKDEEIDESEDINVDIDLEEDDIPESTAPDEDEDSSVEDVTEIPIEVFMKDPEKMAKISDDVDVHESTNWCPQCSDYTIFIDNVCTECGFVKTTKSKKDDDDDEEESKGFQLTPDEDMEIVEDLGYDPYEDDGSDFEER